MSCSINAPAPLQCPTLEESIEATAMLLPRGRAWPANGRSILSRFFEWLDGLSGSSTVVAEPVGLLLAITQYISGTVTPPLMPSPADWPAGFVQMGFIAAIGAVRNFLEAQLCALRLEFWCATETLTNDLWMAEYGLPDDCDPFPNLCAKVAALGGRRCEVYQELLAANGWVVDCVAEPNCQGLNAYAGCGAAGNILVGGAPVANKVEIIVFTNESPSFTGGAQRAPLAGCLQAGMTLACPPDIGPLQCLMERIAPAHVVVSYGIAA
jgi:hypothetical protein